MSHPWPRLLMQLFLHSYESLENFWNHKNTLYWLRNYVCTQKFGSQFTISPHWTPSLCWSQIWFTNENGTSKQNWSKRNWESLEMNRISSNSNWKTREEIKTFDLRWNLKVRTGPLPNGLALGGHEKMSSVRTSVWIVEYLRW